MRTLLLAALCLTAACNDDNNRLAVAEAYNAQLAKDVALLEQQMADVQRQNAVLMLAVAQGQKVPHLIANAGSGNEIDLGAAISEVCAFNTDLNGVVCPISIGTSYAFETPDCSGSIYLLNSTPSPTHLYAGPRGKWSRSSGQQSSLMVSSKIEGFGSACQALTVPEADSGTMLVETTSLVTLYPVSELSIALR